MAAVITTQDPLTTNQQNVNAAQFNALVDSATIANVGSGTGEIAANVVAAGDTFQGVAGTATTGPALRSIGTGQYQFQAGNQLILPAPNGRLFKLTVDNSGAWVSTPL